MATGKRYYWIKLKESFMTSDAVDFLMGQPDGANYVVLYQMLCLKTINTGGKLERHIGEVIIPYDEAKIQRDTKWFSIDTVRVALNLYKALGLVYQDENGTLSLADYDNLVGSETDWAAQKRRQVSSQSPPEIPPPPAESGVENLHTDIEKDIRDQISDIENRDKSSDKEKDALTNPDGFVCRTKDVRRITEAWNSLGLQQLTKVTSESKRGGMLRARVNEYGVKKVLEAIEKIRGSSFLKGQNQDGWTITFEWFVKPNNFPKVLEGNYDNKTGTKKKKSSFTSAADYVPPFSNGEDNLEKMLDDLNKI